MTRKFDGSFGEAHHGHVHGPRDSHGTIDPAIPHTHYAVFSAVMPPSYASCGVGSCNRIARGWAIVGDEKRTACRTHLDPSLGAYVEEVTR